MPRFEGACPCGRTVRVTLPSSEADGSHYVSVRCRECERIVDARFQGGA